MGRGEGHKSYMAGSKLIWRKNNNRNIYHLSPDLFVVQEHTDHWVFCWTFFVTGDRTFCCLDISPQLM